MTTQTIKVTSLTNIGGNIAYTTLVPVVNMSGTPETQKANLQIVGNLILQGAGGSYFAAAANAVLAQSVTNAAQPNITSVGTLTALTVTGNVSAGNANLGNLVVANFFSGDGGLLSNITVSYNDGNVANYLPNYTGTVGANVIQSTANSGSNVQIDANGAVFTFGQGGALYFPSTIIGGEWAIGPNPDDELEMHSHTNVVISTDRANANLHFTFDSEGVFTAEVVVKTIPALVSELPLANTIGAGARAFVSDADSTTFNAPAVGGGSNNMPVFSNGTGWFIG